jgi:hypothetical protein
VRHLPFAGFLHHSQSLSRRHFLKRCRDPQRADDRSLAVFRRECLQVDVLIPGNDRAELPARRSLVGFPFFGREIFAEQLRRNGEAFVVFSRVH